ncbi:GlyGly-CTERM sorting domain-containing protein, partial [Escherichia coli]
DYNDEFKGNLPKYKDQFRASDHDPAVLELNIYGGSLGLGALLGLLGLGVWRRRR